jgi:lysophospholipase L1-like esterase
MQQYFKIGALTPFVLGMASFGVISAASLPRTDKLPAAAWWRDQVNATRDRQLSGCLFGDSISSGLGNTLGRSTFNFAMGGMSSVSLLTQLRQLKAANVQCQKVVIAIGTNDAMYNISNNAFRNNLRQSIDIA